METHKACDIFHHIKHHVDFYSNNSILPVHVLTIRFPMQTISNETNIRKSDETNRAKPNPRLLL
jgi:hypothetical protein